MTRDTGVATASRPTRDRRCIDIDVDIERVYVSENLNLYALCNLCKTLRISGRP